MDKTVREQILKVRDTALCNMFDVGMVKAIARELAFEELIAYVEVNASDYVQFILYGDK
ncbi:MAG: DUF5049 domain-containing protein [Acetivibrio ethanolgignens]